MSIQTNRLTNLFTLSEISFSGGTIGHAVETETVLISFYGTILNERGNKAFDGGLSGAVYLNTISIYARFMNVQSKKVLRLTDQDGNKYKILEFTPVGRNEATIIRAENIK